MRELAGQAGARVWAMRQMFGMAGIGISVWAITVPYTKIRFGLDDGTLGLMLLAGGTGGILAMPLSATLMARFGSRAVILAAGSCIGLLLPVLAVVPTPAFFTLALFVYGALFGALDIALNAQGAVVERMSGRLQMSGFHACYSLGSLSVAALGSLLLQAGLTTPLCALVDMAVVGLALTQVRHLVGRNADAPAQGRRLVLPGKATLVLGLCCFACFLTEGAATDWSTIFLRFSRGMNLADAALGYAAFAVAMAAARFTGDALATRLGQITLMRISCLVAAAGFALVVFVPLGWVGVAGFGLVGLGTGNIAPLVFSAASRVKNVDPSVAVPAVVGVGYAGFLVGPVAIGLIANATSLGASMGVVGVVLGLSFFAARVVG